MTTSIPEIASRRSSFVPRNVSVSLVAMRRDNRSDAVSPSGRPAASRFAVSTESATLVRSLAMLPVCRSTRRLACAVFFVTGSIILRAWVGALWHEVRRIVRAIKFRAVNSRLIVRGLTCLNCCGFARGQQRNARLYCGASLSGRPAASRLSHPPP